MFIESRSHRDWAISLSALWPCAEWVGTKLLLHFTRDAVVYKWKNTLFWGAWHNKVARGRSMNGCADFGSQLRKLRPDWWQFNLNYDELNKRLVEVKREFGLRKALSSRSLTGETRTFAEILDQDVEKIVMFYLRAQGDIGQCNFTSVVVVRLLLLTHEFSFWTPATRLWEMRQRQILNLEGYNLSVEQIEIMCQKYRDLGQVSANKHIYFIASTTNLTVISLCVQIS